MLMRFTEAVRREQGQEVREGPWSQTVEGFQGLSRLRMAVEDSGAYVGRQTILFLMLRESEKDSSTSVSLHCRWCGHWRCSVCCTIERMKSLASHRRLLELLLR